MDVELSWYSPAKTSNNPIHQMKLVEHFLKVSFAKAQFLAHFNSIIGS
jgi:hypothetical protein